MSGAPHPLVITGSSGFVGANLLRYFAARGAPVMGVEGPSGTDWRTRGVPGVELLKVDLSNEAEVRAFVRQIRPSVILNCAAYGAYPSQTESNRIYKVNFDGVRFMLESVRGCPWFRAFVQAGSSSEYGSNCAGPVEEVRANPDSDYAVSKVAATALIQCHAVKYRLPAWVLRLYSIYGPFEDASRLVPRLLLHARNRELPPLVNPAISRDFVYIEDVAGAFDAVIQRADSLRRGEIYNVGAGQRVTLEELVALTRSTFGIDKSPVWGSMPDRHWDHPDWYSNPGKALSQLDWAAKTSLVDGLRSTMRWMESNPDFVALAQKTSVVTGLT